MTVTYLNQDQVSFEALNLKDVANSQWMIINELSAKYKRKIIKGSDSYFEDDSWVGNSIESPTIFWSSYFSLENQEALLILIKIGVYHQIEVKNNTISTMKGYINGLVNILKGVLDTKLILVGVRGQLLNGVNEITSEDLLAALDERIKKGFCIDGNTVGAINILFEIPAHVVNNLPIFLIRFKYPWKNGFENWIKSRHSDLKIPLYQKQPYQPLPSATTHKIIESSMTLIESVGNCVVDLHKILRPLDNHQRDQSPTFLHSDVGTT